MSMNVRRDYSYREFCDYARRFSQEENTKMAGRIRLAILPRATDYPLILGGARSCARLER